MIEQTLESQGTKTSQTNHVSLYLERFLPRIPFPAVLFGSNRVSSLEFNWGSNTLSSENGYDTQLGLSADRGTGLFGGLSNLQVSLTLLPHDPEQFYQGLRQMNYPMLSDSGLVISQELGGSYRRTRDHQQTVGTVRYVDGKKVASTYDSRLDERIRQDGIDKVTCELLGERLSTIQTLWTMDSLLDSAVLTFDRPEGQENIYSFLSGYEGSVGKLRHIPRRFKVKNKAQAQKVEEREFNLVKSLAMNRLEDLIFH